MYYNIRISVILAYVLAAVSAQLITLDTEADFAINPGYQTTCKYINQTASELCNGRLEFDESQPVGTKGFWYPSCSSPSCDVAYSHVHQNPVGAITSFSFKAYISVNQAIDVYVRTNGLERKFATISGSGRWITQSYNVNYSDPNTIISLWTMFTAINKFAMIDRFSINVDSGDSTTTETQTTPSEMSTYDPIHTTEVPIETTTEDPIETTTEDPIETTTEDPIETTTEDPIETTTEDSYESTTEVPFETTTTVPYESTTEVPFETTTEDPVETTTEDLYESTTEVPFETTTEDPVERTTTVPYESTTVSTHLITLDTDADFADNPGFQTTCRYIIQTADEIGCNGPGKLEFDESQPERTIGFWYPNCQTSTSCDMAYSQLLQTSVLPITSFSIKAYISRDQVIDVYEKINGVQRRLGTIRGSGRWITQSYDVNYTEPDTTITIWTSYTNQNSFAMIDQFSIWFGPQAA